jgi:uncharacterized protein (TIGR02099 family)
MMTRCARYLWGSLVVIIIVFALLLNLARALSAVLDRHRLDFERWVSQIVQRPVSIGHVNVTWYDFEPAFSFSNVRIQTGDRFKKTVHIKQFTVAVNLFSSLTNQRWLPGHLGISGMHLDIYQAKNQQLYLSGVPLNNLHASSGSHYVSDMLTWLLTQTQVSLRDISINWHGQEKFVIPIYKLQLNINNNDFSHVIVGDLQLKQAVATQLRYVVHLSSDELNKKSFKAAIYLGAKNMVLAQCAAIPFLQPYLKGITIKSGLADLSVWAKMSSGALHDVHASFSVRHMALSAAALKKQDMFNVFSANTYWQRTAEGWMFSADHLHLKVNGRQWHAGKTNKALALSFQAKTHTHSARWLLNADMLRLHDIYSVMSQWVHVPVGVRTMLNKYRPQGDVEALRLVYTPNKLSAVPDQINASFSFSEAAWRAVGNAPGARGLSGRVAYLPSGGSIIIKKAPAEVMYPAMFAQTFHFNSAGVTLLWRKNTQGHWAFEVPVLALDDGNVRLHAKVSGLLQAHKRPIIKLNAAFSLKNTALIKNYLPKKGISTHLYGWLANAFPAGSAKNGRLMLSGNLQDFPFKKGDGLFDVHATVHGIQLHYQDLWPDVYNIGGLLDFKGQGMSIRANSGDIMGVTLHNLTGTIKDLHQGGIDIHGDVQGDLSQGLQFLEATPLSVGKQFESVQMQGPMRGDLALHIPLHDKHALKTLLGHIHTEGASLKMPAWNTQLTNLSGDFTYTQDSISSSRARATFLGAPAHIVVSSLAHDNKSSAVQVLLSSQMNIAFLKKQYHVQALPFLTGSAAYQAVLSLYPLGHSAKNRLTINSNLKGVALKMPAPLGKAAARVKPLYVRFSLDLKKPINVVMQYGDQLFADLDLSKTHKKLSVARGQVRIGRIPARLPLLKGLVLRVDLPALNVLAWEKFYNNVHASKGGAAFVPRLVDIRLGQTIFLNKIWHALHVRMQPQKNGWIAAIQSRDIVGRVTVPDDLKHGTFLGDFQKFHYQPLAHEDSKPLDPRSLPNMVLSLKGFMYKNKSVGDVKLVAKRNKHGLDFTTLRVQTPGGTITAAGHWQALGHRAQQTAFKGTLSGKDIGLVLKQWKLADVLASSHGGVAFNLRWPNAPSEFSMKTTSGTLAINLADGRILKLSKSAEAELGLGRMLNLFSLQSIPRRLSLNFGDLTAKGFVFNKMKADFSIAKGVASTSNAFLAGPVARVDLHGSIGLAKKTYNLKFDIQPIVTSSLPLIATLAGGPIAGAVVWLVNKVFVSPTVAHATMVKYQVTGTWKHPKVVKLP